MKPPIECAITKNGGSPSASKSAAKSATYCGVLPDRDRRWRKVRHRVVLDAYLDPGAEADKLVRAVHRALVEREHVARDPRDATSNLEREAVEIVRGGRPVHDAELGRAGAVD